MAYFNLFETKTLLGYKNLILSKSKRMTNGLEWCKTDVERKAALSTYTEVHHCNCDYCGGEILAIWDGYNIENYWPYLGVQSKRVNAYFYSPIIEIMRRRYAERGLDWKDNNLLNSHTRVHSDEYDLMENSIRMSDAAVRMLCSNCFLKTYNRYQVLGENGITYAISVVEDRGETIESVMKELSISGKVIGKGAISNY